MAVDDVFPYTMSRWAPFQDQEVCRRVRMIKKEEICTHPNPKLKIELLKDSDVAFFRVHDIFFRIKDAMENDRKLVIILPQPHPQYIKVAWLINRYRVNCRNLHTFNMDEWADQDGNTAPETYKNGFLHAQLNNFYSRIDKDLRPPLDHVHGLTTKNIKDYGKMIADLGGADVSYGGIGWSGHIAFIDPNTPEFGTESIEEFKQMGPRIVTLNHFTIAQASIDADFGMGGDWSWIPPKAATIGPREIIGATVRSSWNYFKLADTRISWQRFSVRLALHGPITPHVPASVLQIGPSEIHISQTVADNIEPDWEASWYT